MRKVSALTVEEFKEVISEVVEDKLMELTVDPDRGKRLREEVKKRLRQSIAAERRGEKGIPVEEVVRRLGLQW
jgi:hypothetical protein